MKRRVNEVVGDYSMAGSRRHQAPGNIRHGREVTGSRASLQDDASRDDQKSLQTAEALTKISLTLVTKDGLILAVSRGSDLSDVNIPGGHVELGEDAKDAAVRELWEETGLLATKLFPIYSRVSGGKLINVYRVVSYTGNLRSSSEGAAGWHAAADLLRSSHGDFFQDVMLNYVS